jgi:hypothetical protein
MNGGSRFAVKIADRRGEMVRRGHPKGSVPYFMMSLRGLLVQKDLKGERGRLKG